MRRGREDWHCSAWRKEAQGNEEERDRVLSEKPRNNLHKLKLILFCLNVSKLLFTVRMVEHWNRFPRNIVVWRNSKHD